MSQSVTAAMPADPIARPRRPGMDAGWLLLPAALLLLFGLFLPLANLLALSLNAPEPGVISPSTDFTFRNYLRFFSTGFYAATLWKTLWMSALTTAITAVLGMILALSIWRAPARWRSLLVLIVLAPLLVSIVARTYGWMIVLGDKGALNTLLLGLGLIDQPLSMMYTPGAVLVGLVHVFLPFMVLALLGALDRIEAALPEAALTLGAGRFATFRHVILPLAVPGLSGGCAIVFSLAMSSYVTPALMGGSRAGVLTTFIYQQFSVTLNWQFGAALVGILLAVTLLVLGAIIGLAGWYTRGWANRSGRNA
ncbi:ABC transporter permease [Acetobacteraceae bacterium H6797]|nr:ABC transporter permease [Acetobacteraceae bacterium H6797]